MTSNAEDCVRKILRKELSFQDEYKHALRAAELLEDADRAPERLRLHQKVIDDFLATLGGSGLFFVDVSGFLP